MNESSYSIRRANADLQKNYLYSIKDIGDEIVNNPYANLSYQKINQQGTQILIDHDFPPSPNIAGEYNPATNTIHIYEQNNLNPRDVVATMIHESIHVQYRTSKGIKNNTLYEEFRAFSREFLYRNRRRPNLSERKTIWKVVNSRYKGLPIGKNPFKGEE